MEKSLINDKKGFSLELFPFKNRLGEQKFWNTAQELRALSPQFFSITTNQTLQRNRVTEKLVTNLKSKLGCEVAAHMVLVEHSNNELEELAKDYWQAGIKSVVALRGDVRDQSRIAENRYAADLVRILKNVGDFDISVAGYPEKHPQATSFEQDLENLKLKEEAGASRVISQFFFDPAVFLRFRDQAAAYKIKIPIIPGILPINDFAKLVKFAQKCQAKVPKNLYDIFDANSVKSKKMDEKSLAMGFLSYQISTLVKEGVNFFHFYALNSDYLVKEAVFLLKHIISR